MVLRAWLLRKYLEPVLTKPAEHRMSSNSVAPRDAAAAQAATSVRRNSYSRKRWNSFDAWQEHVRKSAATVGVAFSGRHDRDLRRAVFTG
jgi:hypothetical protein